MARKHKLRHTDDTRARIQTGLLVNFLHDHALKAKQGKHTTSAMMSTRIKAAEILLDRVLPKLAMQAIVKADDPLRPRTIQVQIVDPAEVVDADPVKRGQPKLITQSNAEPLPVGFLSGVVEHNDK